MTKLSAKEEAFIARMQDSRDLEAHGYEALIRKGRARRFFEPLNAAGFFRPERNPRPVTEGNGVRVPAWPALQFLLAVAKEVPQEDEVQIAQAITKVIRDVSRTHDADGVITANFYTWGIFAELLGLLPLTAIADEDIALIRGWIVVPLNNGLIVQALDEGLLARLLDSGRVEDTVRAVAVLDQCTMLRTVESAGRKETRTVGDPYWVNTMVERHARALGRRAGAAAAKMTSERLREAFTATSTHESFSSAYRAAVEDDSQNGDWHEAENIVVSALRDVLLGWCEAGSAESTEFVVRLLKEGIEIQRRVALFTINEAWDHFSFDDVLKPEVFRPGHLHELYRLLAAHFSALTPEQKDKVVHSIESVALNNLSEEGRAHFQASVLHAIAGQGFEPADKLLTDIETRFPALRDGETHWDFHSYTETRIGPGPSPFSPQELIAFAEEGTLRERVESFKEGNRWSGPTREGLIDNIKAASRSASQAFIRRLPNLHDAGYDLIYPVLHGIKASWEEESADRRPEWQERWPAIFDCFESLAARVQQAEPEQASGGRLVPTREWVISMVAEFLLATTKDDSRLYPDEFIQRGWNVIQSLLRASERASKVGEDPVSQAINRPAGHVIEAMFSHALRLMRKADREKRDHSEWGTLAAVFEAELRTCKDANFEMSTLSGMYLAQLLYIDRTWTENWMPTLFPLALRDSFACAIAGAAYTANTWQVYELLVKHGAVDEALRRRDLPGRSTRESILGRMAAAFAHGKEELESPRFGLLFAEGQADDIREVARTLATFAKGEGGERYRDRLIAFWRRCEEWSRGREDDSGQLLATLAFFTAALDRMDDTTKPLVLAIAPYVDVGMDIYGFVDALSRFADADPDDVVEVLRTAVAGRRPTFDYEGKLKKLLTQLVDKGKTAEVFSLLDALQQVSGMTEFYNQLADGKNR